MQLSDRPPAIGSFAQLVENFGQDSPWRDQLPAGRLSSPLAGVVEEAASFDLGIWNNLKHSRSLCLSGNLIESWKDLTRKTEMNEGTLICGGSGVASGANSANSCLVERQMTAKESAEKLLAADAEHRSLAADQVLMLRMTMPMLGVGLKTLQEGINSWMQHQGFWTSDNKGEKIALVHSEVSEWLEAVRKGDSVNEAEEMADTIIRILDYAGQHRIDLGRAIEQKMIANYQRPFRHGKAF